MTDSPDSYEIKDKSTYNTAVQARSRKSRPPAILRFIMQALEKYRQNRKMGWSRPWNKYGIMTFQSFKLDFSGNGDSAGGDPVEAALIDGARAVVAAECAAMPEEAAAFIDDLLADASRSALMGFVFVHEFTENDNRFEGVTLSFGRVKDKRFRDRFDLIFEAPVGAAGVGEFSRLRVFVDPYLGVGEPAWTTTVDPVAAPASKALFDRLAELSWDWAGEDARIWDHWTSAYIEYFGPRQWPAEQSHFHSPDAPPHARRAAS